jgi:hypothetical protein
MLDTGGIASFLFLEVGDVGPLPLPLLPLALVFVAASIRSASILKSSRMSCRNCC